MENSEISDQIGPQAKLISSLIDESNILSYDRRGRQIEANLTDGNKYPAYYHEAMRSEDRDLWNQAIKKELDNRKEYNVWDEVEIKEGIKPLKCLWVLRTKRNEMNIPIENKARLCVQGFDQSEGLDYFTTYAPTGKMTSLRLLILFSLKQGLNF